MSDNIDDPKVYKRFVNNVKLYFSSLTARRGNFLYTGITDRENEYILSNLEPEKFIKYCDATFAIHIIKFKDVSVIEDIDKVLGLLNLPNAPYVTRITTVLSILNKCKFKLDDLTFTRDKNGITYHLDTVGKKTIIGYPMVIYQATQFLNTLYAQYSQISNTVDTYISKPIDSEGLDQGVIRARFKVQEYTKLVTEFDVTNDLTEFVITLIDGAETVSNREYIKRIKLKYIYDLVTWVRNGCVEYATLYIDECIEVRSTRPHTRIYLQPRKKDKTP